MRQFIQLIVIGSLFIAAPLAADESHQHAEQQSAGPPPATPAPGRAEESTPMMMGPMQDNMDKMREQMTAIRQTKDPKERERLMQDHMKLMMGQMEMMKSMRGGGIHGSGAAAGTRDSAELKEAVTHGFDITSQRLNALEEMMDQVLFQQETILLQLRQRQR